MDIRHLEYFSEVAKELNFTKASANLHVSQPTLSKTIKSMETELGIPLFYRSSRKLKLTDAGEALLQNTKQVLHAYEHLTTAVNEVMDIKKGTIKIGIPPIIGAAFCSIPISLYINKFPLIDITLREVGSNMILEGINDGSLDIGFICHYPKNIQEVESLQLLKDPLMVLVHNQHPFTTKKRLSIADLTEQLFIMYHRDFSLYHHIMKACEEEGFQPDIVCESSQKEFIIKMVAAKLGIALLPSRIAQNIKDEHVIAVPLSESPLYLNLSMVWKEYNYIPIAVKEFISVVNESMKKGTF